MDPIMQEYCELVGFLGKVLGQDYEVVLHDLTNMDNSVVAVANGHVSGRKIGSPMNENGLRLIRTEAWKQNQELIRYRMFMTKLKPGCEDEYKSRHDALAAQRGGVPDPGPDSNFSIWSAGGYIFGYDEIDTTMEVDETPEAHEETIAWETRQLGIMDWITNDVDWMTGEHHAASIRLAWHPGK